MVKKILVLIFLSVITIESSWAVKCDAKDAERWDYLSSNPSLAMRHRIFAELLKKNKIKSLVEIGGFCTPICNFHKDIKYYNLDPFVYSTASYDCKDATLVQESVETADFSKLEITKPYAVAIIGLYWEFLRDKGGNAAQLPFVKNSIKNASLLVVENVPNIGWLNEHREQIINYAKSVGMKEVLNINIDVLGKQPDPYAYYRQMVVLRK